MSTHNFAVNELRELEQNWEWDDKIGLQTSHKQWRLVKPGEVLSVDFSGNKSSVVVLVSSASQAVSSGLQIDI